MIAKTNRLRQRLKLVLGELHRISGRWCAGQSERQTLSKRVAELERALEAEKTRPLTAIGFKADSYVVRKPVAPDVALPCWEVTVQFDIDAIIRHGELFGDVHVKERIHALGQDIGRRVADTIKQRLTGVA